MANSIARVLIVEDDPVFRRGLARVFKARETQVTEAADGAQALALIDDNAYDLVICDYRLPGADGLVVLARLRFARRRTPFILVTAHYSDAVVDEARALGANAVIEKPIELSRLIEECERFLGRSLRTGQTVEA